MTSVAVAYLHANKVSHSFMESLMGVLAHEQATENRIKARIPVCSGVDSMDKSRNFAVQTFLDLSDSEWLWFLDTDMGFAGDTLNRLLESAETAQAKVIGGLYFTPADVQPDGFSGWTYEVEPVAYGWGPCEDQEEGLRVMAEWPENAVFPVAGIGTGCMMIHREVLKAVRESEGDVWFNYLHYRTGERIGEDLSFCLRINKYGYAPFVDSGVTMTHHKEVWLKG